MPFRPHPLLRSGHLQTLMVGIACGPRPQRNAQSHQIDLPDGDALVVHEELGAPTAQDAPLVILIHGLGGDHTSPYLQRLAHQIRLSGKQVWRVDLRGSGHGSDLAWRPPHAGASQDLAAIVHAAADRFPQSPICLVGFSLSGNIVLKLLGESASTPSLLTPSFDPKLVHSAITVAPPIDLHDCADNMDRWSRRIYTQYYLRALERQVQRKRNQWPQWRALPDTPKVKSIRQFDARYTAPLSGFRDADHYYSDSSSIHLLEHITTPTTILVDRHDPIVSYHIFQKARYNTSTIDVVETSRGGHMGYLGIDSQGKTIRWMEHFVLATLASERYFSSSSNQS